MPRRVLETLTGVGEVHVDGELLRRTRYELTLWTDDPDDTVHVDGHIDITGIGEAVVLAGPDRLTLCLADGRRLPFRLTNSGGGIVGNGGLEL
jgi:hypothetical protein